jgi:uncharacterized membrane protein YcaP (DUF421 family)
MLQGFYWLIGVEKEIAELTILQMIARTVFVYGIALAMIRLGKRRFLGGYTAFDILMGFVIGSILSRAITGRENLLSTAVVVLTLVAIHYLISVFTYYFGGAGNMLKNTERQLIKNGKVVEAAMEKSKLGENDLLQALRQQGNVEKPKDVESAYLERDGSITVIPKEKKPQIIDIRIEEGVQIVKVEIVQ